MTTILAFNLAIMAALISPGPAFLITLKSALSDGRRAGLHTALGLAFGACIWAVLALLGLTALLAALPAAFIALKILGATYLLYLAFHIWKDAKTPLTQTADLPRRGIKLGLMTNLANPKSVFFIAAIFSTLLPANLTLSGKAGILLNLFLLEFSWYACVAIIMTTSPIKRGYMRLKTLFDRLAAIMLGAIAARIAL